MSKVFFPNVPVKQYGCLFVQINKQANWNQYQNCHIKKWKQDLQVNILVYQFKCMKYVELRKFCLSHPGELKAKVDLNVLCIFSYVVFLVLVPIDADTMYVFSINSLDLIDRYISWDKASSTLQRYKVICRMCKSCRLPKSKIVRFDQT